METEEYDFLMKDVKNYTTINEMGDCLWWIMVWAHEEIPNKPRSLLMCETPNYRAVWTLGSKILTTEHKMKWRESKNDTICSSREWLIYMYCHLRRVVTATNRNSNQWIGDTLRILKKNINQTFFFSENKFCLWNCCFKAAKLTRIVTAKQLGIAFEVLRKALWRPRTLPLQHVSSQPLCAYNSIRLLTEQSYIFQVSEIFPGRSSATRLLAGSPTSLSGRRPVHWLMHSVEEKYCR